MTARLDNEIGRVTLPLAYDSHGIPRSEILQDSPAVHMAYSTAHQLGLAHDHFHSLSNRHLQIRFEDVLSKPRQVLKQSSAWLDMNPAGTRLEDMIDTRRALRPQVHYSRGEVEMLSSILQPLRIQMGYWSADLNL